MALTRSDYGRNPNEGAPRNVANGWTGVWPAGVPSSLRGVARAGGIEIPIQKGLVDLVETLLECMVARGYKLKPGQCWGYANRAIAGTRTPSNHSRAKAVDINSVANPMQSVFKSDIPPAAVNDWEVCGWYWGGRYGNRPDAMHFEYIGRPEHAAHLAKAKAILAKLRGAPVPPATPKWEARVDAKPGARVIGPLSVGPDVEAVQGFLRVTADGKFGETTKAAVVAYQKAHGLDADGVVGDATWKPLLFDLKLAPKES